MLETFAIVYLYLCRTGNAFIWTKGIFGNNGLTHYVLHYSKIHINAVL